MIVKQVVLTCALSLLTTSLLAQSQPGLTPSEQPKPDYANPLAAAAYCEYVQGVGDSLAAPLMSPVVFASIGNSTAELLPTDLSASAAVSNRNRFIVGGSFSFANLQKGLALKGVAHADCERYKIAAGLEAFLQDNGQAFTSASLQARAAVLHQALPQSDEIVARTKKSLESYGTTVQELHGMQLRRDELQQILEQTDSDMGRAARSESLAGLPLSALLQKHTNLETQLERAHSRSRSAGAWDFSLRVGYDRTIGATQTTPIFGTATLSFNLGHLWQAKPEKRAREGFALWNQQDPVGIGVRTTMLLQRFRAIHRAEAERLQQAEVLIADLEQRMKSVRELSDQKAQSYADYLWFDYVKLKAEHAYLTAHLQDLSAVTEDTDVAR